MRNDQDARSKVIFPDGNHADHFVITSLQRHTPDTGGRTAHGPHIIFMKTDRISFSVGNHHLAVAVRQAGIDQRIPFIDRQGADLGNIRFRIFLDKRFLDRPLLGAKQDIMTVHKLLVLDIADDDVGFDFIFLRQFDQVLDDATLGRLGCLRNFIHPDLIKEPLLAQQEEMVVGTGHKHVLHEIFVPGLRGFGTFASAAL